MNNKKPFQKVLPMMIKKKIPNKKSYPLNRAVISTIPRSAGMDLEHLRPSHKKR